MTTGIGKRRAIEESAFIIETLFEHKDRLGIEVRDMSVFGQDKMSWVTSSIVDLLNKGKVFAEEIDRLEEESEMSTDETTAEARKLLDRSLSE